MEFYYHDISPPSQAVWMTLNMLGVKYDAKEVDLFKAEQKSKEFLEINPMGRVPALKDGEFTLGESRAIAVYLCLKYEAKDKLQKLYPTEMKEMSKVNMMLNLDNEFYQKTYSYASIGRMLRREELEADKLEDAHSALASIEMFLNRNPFMVGDHVTIADIFVLATVKILELAAFNDWGKYPKLSKWKALMEKQPHYEESMGKHVSKWAEKFTSKQ